MRVFLISGKAGCGKNEVANIIKEELPNTVITAFSKYIKLFKLYKFINFIYNLLISFVINL